MNLRQWCIPSHDSFFLNFGGNIMTWETFIYHSSHGKYCAGRKSWISQTWQNSPILVFGDNQLFTIFSVIFITFWSSQGNLSSKKAGKLKKMERFKTCHDLLKTCHDSTKQNAFFRHWEKRVTMAKTWHYWWNPNSISCYTR